jgi:hypothetical protein
MTSANLLTLSAFLAASPIWSQEVIVVEAPPATASEAKPSDTKTAVPKPPEVKLPSMLESLKKVTFARTAAVTLREWAGVPAPDAPKPPTPQPSEQPPSSSGAATPPPPPADPNVPLVEKLHQEIALGNWAAFGKFLTEHFLEKPQDGKQAYQHVVDSLGKMTGPQNQNQMNGNPMPSSFRVTNVLSPDDVLQLAQQNPAEFEPELLQKFGGFLSQAIQRGSLIETVLQAWDKGTGKLGGKDAAKRRDVARLLIAAGQRIDAAKFLLAPEAALKEKDLPSLNLLAISAEGRFAKDGKPEDLEAAWKITQSALTLPEPEPKERALALRRAVELAPKVKAELGAKWLGDSFTSQPALGREILAGIGTATLDSRMQPQAESRLVNLELASRAVESLLKADPKRANEWSSALTLLAMNWMAEAKWTQERDSSVSRGPSMSYDMFGNVFFGDYYGGNQNPNQQNQIQPIPTGKMLPIAPTTPWVEAVESSLRPALLTQIANLHLKVKNEADAFPLIEQLAKTNPSEAKELAVRFIEVWGENHDPNADKRRTNRYMYIYGYNPPGDGIPLTRSRQERNLEELSKWVQKLRDLPGGGLDEAKIAAAFMRTHSSAEVYRLANIEKVFGGLEKMKAPTFAAILQTMRTNLATVWRSPKEQQAKKTKRTDKEILAEVQRGYDVCDDMLKDGLKQYPDDWKLRLVKAALLLDGINFRNQKQKDSSFSAERAEAFAVFKEAAELYTKALTTMEEKDQSVDVFTTWFYASLGAPDLEAVKAELTPAPKQTELIRTALMALPGEVGKRHETLFANSLSTRMTAAAPAVKHRYLSQGLPIAGTNERAREARELFAYYADLVTEIKLHAHLDGPDTVGTEPFGLFVDIRHTKQIEREAGGFQKYLQNQNNQMGFYNFGRPLENYRDKFEEAAREALKESFDVLSVTFHTDKIQSRGDEEEGWRVTPYCYFLIKAKGPQTDALPAFKLNLDFMDTSGYAVLPIESPRLPLDAAKPSPARPVRKLTVQQILDERKAAEGLLGLEIKATSRGLVPPLETMLNLLPADFEIVKQDDQGVRIVELDAGDETEDEPVDAVSERIWNISFKAKTDLKAPAKNFTFAQPLRDEISTAYFRYADADLQSVSASVDLAATYGKRKLPWLKIIGSILGLGLFIGIWLRLKGRQPASTKTARFHVPGEITPLSVIGLLERIKQHANLKPADHAELDQTLANLQSHFYTRTGSATAEPDLTQAATDWVRRATG